jgi:cytochrome P450
VEAPYWDPFDVELDADPYATWARLRDEAPVYRNERYDFWALSRYDDVEAAHRDPDLFRSAHGTVLELMSSEPQDTGMMIFMDPPVHGPHRALVSRAFTPRRVAALEPHIRRLCGELLASWDGDGPFDFVTGFGGPLPSLVIAELLGVPAGDRKDVTDRIDRTFHIEPGVGMVNDVSLTAQIELHGYLLDQLHERRSAPRDDLLTALLEAEVTDADGTVRRLTDDAAANFAFMLVVAGTETVARLLGWAAIVLADHADERRLLAGEPGLVANAVEELLRYEAPSPVQGRVTSRSVTRHGTTIPAGGRVLLLTGAAGRDGRRFADPDRFDVRRDLDRHLSFGSGLHFCLGAALARLEGRVALEETLARHPDWEVDRAGAVRLHTSTVRGWSSVPVYSA